MVQVSLFFLLSFMRDQLDHGPDLSDTTHKKHSWSHQGQDGPDTWYRSYDKCGGRSQSPINFNTTEMEYDQELKPFVLHNYNHRSTFSDDLVLNITNNGHSASTKVSGDLFIEGGGLPGRYNTAEFHFHWGSNEDRGSEHTINGHHFPLEMHIVHYAAQYGNLSNALTKPDGLAVLGVYFQISQQDNPNFEPLVEALEKVTKHGQSHTVANFLLDSVIPKDREKYFRYKGSLTTPPCYETVIWTVFSEPEKISLRQLRYLRHLIQHDHDEVLNHHGNGSSHNHINYMVDNYRPLQSLNGRTVSCSYMASSDNVDAQDTPSTSSSFHPDVSGAGTKNGLEVAEHHENISNSETQPGTAEQQSAASSSQTGTHAMTGSKGDNQRLQDNSETPSQMTGHDKTSIMSGANQVPKHTHAVRNSGDPKAQSQRQIHTVSEQFTDIKLQTAEVMADPKASVVLSRFPEHGTYDVPTLRLRPLQSTELSPPVRLTRPLSSIQSGISPTLRARSTEHALSPVRLTRPLSSIQSFGGPTLPIRSTEHALSPIRLTRPLSSFQSFRGPAQPARIIKPVPSTVLTPITASQPISFPKPNENRWSYMSRTKPRIENAQRRIFHRPNLRYNRPTQILTDQTPPIRRPPSPPRQTYQRHQSRQPSWHQRQQLQAMLHAATTTREPYVFLQPVSQPIRLSKQTYYHYYNDNGNDYRPQGFGVDISNFGEFRRRRRRSINYSTSKRKAHRRSARFN